MGRHQTDELEEIRPVHLPIRREDCPEWLVRMVDSGHRAVTWRTSPQMYRRRHSATPVPR